MRLTELTNEQRRQIIDVVQVFASWRDADRKAVPGSLRWVSRKGAEYSNESMANRRAPWAAFARDRSHHE